MRPIRRMIPLLVFVAALLPVAPPAARAGEAPAYRVDPFWPKPLPNKWILGQVAGIAVDRHDHVWIIQRPRTLTDDERAATFNPPNAKCCVPAPPVIEFDQEGNVVQAWGGPGEGYDWPANEHGIYLDGQDNVWIGGNGRDDHQVLKFTRDGRFLMQIGKAGKTGGSNDPLHLGRPALAVLDEQPGELFVADGYLDKRIVVFDARSGAYKRHWGAYGSKPVDDNAGPYDPDAEPAGQFRNPVHCVRIANDGLVYVCDRVNDRLQVFRKDGSFVTEFRIEPRTRAAGSVWDVAFSPDPEQQFLFVADGTNEEIHVVSRKTGEVLSSFGRAGRQAGEFHYVHNIAVDSRGNLFTTEVDSGKRVQRFVQVR